jgi:HK97 family phage major capsid protein
MKEFNPLHTLKYRAFYQSDFADSGPGSVYRELAYDGRFMPPPDEFLCHGEIKMRKSIQLKDERMALVTQSRAILDKAEAEKRKTTPDEQETLRKMNLDLDTFDAEILMHEKQESRESNASAHSTRPGAADPVRDDATGGFKAGQTIRGTKAYHEAFCAAMFGAGIPEGIAPEIRNALQSDSATEGGYLVASEQLAGRLIEIVDNEVFIRRMATKTTLTSAASLGIPARLTDVSDPVWTAELGTGAQDTALTLAKRELRPHPLAKQILISKKLLRLTPMVEELVLKRLGYKNGIAQENAFLNGSGAGQPLGVFTPTADGIDTSRDVVTGSTTGFVAASNSVSPGDCLLNALYMLKSQYQAKATWIFHRTTVSKIRQMKDTLGQWIWAPGISAGEPDRILNRPFYMSEYCPNTMTTGQYIGIVGDFSKYEIVDALDIEIQRLVELFALTNQVGFISRAETDGMPGLAEAFVRIKCS